MSMQDLDFRGQWILVTGASSGLGREMARILAAEHRANLIVVARRQERLEQLREELESGYGTHVRVVSADLSKIAEVDRVIEATRSVPTLQAAILNAGVTHFGPHEALEWDKFESMLQTNVTSVVRMSNELIPQLERHPSGGALLLVSSMAGLTPIPFQSAYSGTKAFLVHFGCGLSQELRGRNVSVTTYAPAGIATEMTSGESFQPLAGWLMDVDRAAKEGVRALQRRTPLHVPGVVNKVGAIACRLLPSGIVTGGIGSAYRRALEQSGTLNTRRR